MAQDDTYADPALDQTEQQKIDEVADEMAEKANAEIAADEEVAPGDKEFTK